MELTISGSQKEIESLISSICFRNKDPTPIDIPEVKPEVITKVIPLPPIFDTKIERITEMPKPIEVIDVVKGKSFSKHYKSKIVEILFEDGTLYKKFISVAAASHYFGKSNLNVNIRNNFKFSYNDIWFTIQYQK